MTELLKDIRDLFLDFIGFLFDLDFSKSEESSKDPFDNIKDILTPPDGAENASFTPKEVFIHGDTALLEAAFGRETAEYINELREDVDRLVKDNTLRYEDSVYVVLPPEKLPGEGLAPIIIDNIIEKVYSQFDGDVILRPGKINVFATGDGLKYAEMYIEYYKPTEEFITAG